MHPLRIERFKLIRTVETAFGDAIMIVTMMPRGSFTFKTNAACASSSCGNVIILTSVENSKKQKNQVHFSPFLPLELQGKIEAEKI